MHTEAANGVVGLLRRKEWRASGVGDALRTAHSALLLDKNEATRMLSTYGVPFSGADGALNNEELMAEIASLLRVENAHAVQHVLLKFCWSLLDRLPVELDALLNDISSSESWEILRPGSTGGAKPDRRVDRDEALYSILVRLAVVHGAPHATELVRAWLSTPLPNAQPTERVVSHLRDYLRPREPVEPQATAFGLLSEVLPAITDIESLPDDADRATMYKLAHAIASQLYFSGGAFKSEAGEEADVVTAEELARLAALARPVLRVIGTVQAAQITDRTVRVLAEFLEVEFLGVLTEIASIVPIGSSYSTADPAASFVVEMLTRTLAERKAVILESAEGTAAFKHLLQAFATAGHPGAIELAYELSDVFR